MKKISLICFLFIILTGEAFANEIGRKLDRAKDEINSFIRTKDARFGIACIYDGKDTLQINGDREFPMLSVYKFPQAAAFVNFCIENNLLLEDSIDISSSELKIYTYSPMRDKYGVKNLKLPLKELLYYSLVETDNNACDILFERMGGPVYADSFVSMSGFSNIHIQNTEEETHQDIYLSYQNWCTPLEMCRFIDYFNDELVNSSKEFGYIAYLMENCKTGMDRLVKPMISTNAIIGHKTGTGDIDSQNRIIGINDVGYVKLPGDHSYSISVFVADSSYSPEVTSSFIARISEIIWINLQK